MTKLLKKLNYLRPLDAGKLIRLGNNKDGGYVISNLALKKSDTLISFGLGDNFSFEKNFLIIKKKQKFLFMIIPLIIFIFKENIHNFKTNFLF